MIHQNLTPLFLLPIRPPGSGPNSQPNGTNGAPGNTPAQSNSGPKPGVIAGVVVGVLAVILALGLVWWFYIRPRMAAGREATAGALLSGAGATGPDIDKAASTTSSGGLAAAPLAGPFAKERKDLENGVIYEMANDGVGQGHVHEMPHEPAAAMHHHNAYEKDFAAHDATFSSLTNQQSIYSPLNTNGTGTTFMNSQMGGGYVVSGPGGHHTSWDMMVCLSTWSRRHNQRSFRPRG